MKKIIEILLLFASILSGCNGHEKNIELKQNEIKKLSVEIQEDPTDGWAYLLRANKYFSLKEYDYAIDDYIKGFSFAKGSSVEYYLLAKAYLLTGENQKSFETIESGIAENGDSFYLVYQRAINYDYIGEYEKAAEDYTWYINQRLYENFPQNYSFAIKRRAFVQLLSNVRMDADLIPEAVKYNRDDPELFYLAALINYGMYDAEAAIKFAKDALAINKNYNNAYILLAIIYIDMGKKEASQEYFNQGLETGYGNQNVVKFFSEDEIVINLQKLQNNEGNDKYQTAPDHPLIPLVNLDEELSYFK